MQAEKLMTDSTVLSDVVWMTQVAALRAYRDGFAAALVAVSNAALDAPRPTYAVVVAAIEAARQQLEADLEVALDGEAIHW